MGRSWTWIEDSQEKTEEEMEEIEPLLNDLAAQWSTLHDANEQRGFRRQAAMEGEDYDEPEPEDEADAYRMQQLDALRQRQHAAQVEAIEDALFAHGARMMRPYEHWNEDERYMQYMESRYDY